MSILMAYSVVVDIINDFVPGYDYMKLESEKQQQLDLEQEKAETAELQKNMDEFMHESGLDDQISHDNKEGGC